MDEKPKTYWQEFAPLWWEGFRLWIGGGTLGQLVTSIVFSIVPPFLYLYFEQVDIALENLSQLGFAILIGLFWYSLIAIITYIGANVKLYQKQIEKRKGLGEFTENPFRVDIHPPDPNLRRGERRRWSLELNNKMSNKKIENCYVSLDKVFNTKDNKPPERIQLYLMWNADLGEENQRKPMSISGGGRAVCDVVIEAGNTTVYYLTWISEKIKKSVNPGEYILCFTMFGDWDEFSKGHPYSCKMIVEQNYEVLLNDLQEGEYVKSPAIKLDFFLLCLFFFGLSLGLGLTFSNPSRASFIQHS